MKMKPAGYRIMVEAEMPKEYKDLGYQFNEDGDIVSGSGLLIAGQEAERDFAAQTIGRVVELGPVAYVGICDDTPWCKPGDLIVYARHVSRKVPKDFAGDRQLFLLNDKDVELVLEENNE